MGFAYCADVPGGVEVLQWRDLPTPEPQSGEVVVEQTAVGLNFIDVYMTSGLYPFPETGPQIPGGEAAGRIMAIGPDVSGFEIGDRVAYSTPNGAYREERVMPADRLVKLPDGVEDEMAAAMMLKGMTVEYLLNRSFPVKAGTKVLFHAAAGGVGLIAGQWLKYLGAEAIGTVGSAEKAEQAKAAGYSHVINYNEVNFAEAVADITNGSGVDVVYDAVGQSTYQGSLQSLRPFGYFISFGQSSGVIENFNTGDLAKNGSLYAQRPTLFSYIATRAMLEEVSGHMLKMVAEGHINVNINQRYHLKDVPVAFEALTSRKTSGATIFTTGR